MFNYLFTSKTPVRSPKQQKLCNLKTQDLTLYYAMTCPFCYIVKNKIKKLALNIELKNINKDKLAYNELILEGGKPTVPCLKIEDKGKVTWLYESSDITTYLEEKFVPEKL